jgi:CheY-like chemotaxis protein
MKEIFETPKAVEKLQGTPERKATILLADDDAAIRQILYRLLVDEGYNVITAGNGVEAIEIALMSKIDLLLLDLNMPVKDGWTVFEQISTNFPSLPVILITARPNQFFSALASGASALMEKPLDFTQLFLTIHNLLEEPVAVRLARAIGRSTAFNFVPPIPEPMSIRTH